MPGECENKLVSLSPLLHLHFWTDVWRSTETECGRLWKDQETLSKRTRCWSCLGWRGREAASQPCSDAGGRVLSLQSHGRIFSGAVSPCNDELDDLQVLHSMWEEMNLPEMLPASFHSLLTNHQKGCIAFLIKPRFYKCPSLSHSIPITYR